MTRVLCRLDELDATSAREIVLNKDGARVSVFVLKYRGHILGYVNSCPHVRLPLNWTADVFLDVSRTYLFCANHGAHFDVMSGLCIRGPCKGQSLTPYPVRVEDDSIVTDDI